MMSLLLNNWRIALMVISAGVVVMGVVNYGNRKYNEGVIDTTADFVIADKKGAETVHETATKTLDNIGDDTSPDELLGETGGLRD